MKEAFQRNIWGTIIAFRQYARVLIWSQVVMYWTTDLQMPSFQGHQSYVPIGIVGIFSMPGMGVVADRVVEVW